LSWNWGDRTAQKKMRTGFSIKTEGGDPILKEENGGGGGQVNISFTSPTAGNRSQNIKSNAVWG